MYDCDIKENAQSTPQKAKIYAAGVIIDMTFEGEQPHLMQMLKQQAQQIAM